MRTAIAVAFLAASVPDIAPNPRHRAGMDLAPRGSAAVTTDVAMRAEVVEITIHESHAAVTAVFEMENTANREESLEVGFPTAARVRRAPIAQGLDYEPSLFDPGSIYGFVAKVDGQVVQAERESIEVDGPAPEHRHWICWPMTFEPGQRRRVEVAYEVETRDDLYVRPFSPLQPREVTYVLKTGRGWKGVIGSARVVLRTAGTITLGHVERATPPPTARGEDTWEWHFEDFEPDADITVRYRAYRDAADAVARIAPLLEEHPHDAVLQLDWAENQAALGAHATAAPVFARLVTGQPGRTRPKSVHARCYACPLEYRAARSFRLAGDLESAQRFVRPALERVDERLASLRARLARGRVDEDDDARLRELERIRAELLAWRDGGSTVRR